MNNYSFNHTIKPRPDSNDQLLIDVLDGLLERYIDRVPDAQKIIQLITDRGDKIINDHIAFRSIHIESILKVFLHLGYEVKMDHQTNQPFNFESKKLTAVWLKHPNEAAPRVFVSHFRFDEGSKELQTIISQYLNDWDDPIDTINLNNASEINQYLHTAQWKTPTYKDYKRIQNESEYLSWVLYNKYYLNHFTLTVHRLSSFEFENEILAILSNYQRSFQQHKSSEIKKDALNMLHKHYQKHFEQFNKYLVDNNFIMNGNGAIPLLNISPDKKLLQSSTKSKMIDAEFKEGVFQIPGSYVEFAYRGLLDSEAINAIQSVDPIVIQALERRDGFETQNADKIFESTYIGKEDPSKGITKSSYQKSCEKLAAFLTEYDA